ncbi:MAG: SDR family oxidoreductase [Hyphomicrobiales bacterium]|nr:SDR family oxidoreductase [Hyphomicrobiales bacterium]
MNDIFSLSGRHALVTGASGGLGRQFARTLAAAGALVTVAARRADRCAETVTLIAAAGGRAQAVNLDVTDAAGVAAAFDAATEMAGAPVDVVVNNAGVAVTKPALKVTEDDWDWVMDTNLKGVWLVAQEAARRMAAPGPDGAPRGGNIVNIASIIAFRQGSRIASYAISKAGVVQLTKILALELADKGIRVNALAPGYVITDMNRDILEGPAGQVIVQRIPQGRFGRPEDLDGPLLLLASDASSFMTGSVIAADGGQLVNSL